MVPIGHVHPSFPQCHCAASSVPELAMAALGRTSRHPSPSISFMASRTFTHRLLNLALPNAPHERRGPMPTTAFEAPRER